MSKFKKGDRVIVVRAREDEESEHKRVGKVFSVEWISDGGYIYLLPEGIYDPKANDLVLEQVYLSPLYQALT